MGDVGTTLAYALTTLNEHASAPPLISGSNPVDAGFRFGETSLHPADVTGLRMPCKFHGIQVLLARQRRRQNQCSLTRR